MDLLNLTDIWTVLVFVFAFCATYYAVRSHRRFPPGPRAWPIVGNLFEFRANTDKFPEAFMEYTKTYGNIFRVTFGNVFIVIVNGKELVHEVLVDRSDVFSDRPEFSWMASQIGSGIVLSNGKKWRSLRRLCIQAIREFGMRNVTVEENIMDEMNILVDLLSENKNKPILMHEYMAMAATNVISTVLFGSRFNYDDSEFRRTVKLLNETLRAPAIFQLPTALPVLRYIPGLGKVTRKTLGAYKELYDFVSDRIRTKEKTYNENNICNLVDFFFKLRDEGKYSKYTREDLIYVIVDMLLGGTETVATTLNWSLLFMMAYPDVQTKCQEEIDKIVGHTRRVKYEDREQLVYTQATLCEVQRLASVFPLSVPHATLQDTTLGGYTIPRKSVILVNLMSVHLDPELWPEPETFSPERFISDGQLTRNEAYMPFSKGPRACAGECLARVELFLYFANLLQQFTFKPPEGVSLNLQGYTGITRSPHPYKVIPIER